MRMQRLSRMDVSEKAARRLRDGAPRVSGRRGGSVRLFPFVLPARKVFQNVARGALQEAQERGAVTISEGTKGGLEREIPITSPAQLEALQRAAEAQGGDKSMIPSDQSWKSWREQDLRDARDLVSAYTGGGLHDLRAAYACERYEALTGHAAPAAGGSISDRDADREARETIASELGHGRIDVVGEYVGGR